MQNLKMVKIMKRNLSIENALQYVWQEINECVSFYKHFDEKLAIADKKDAFLQSLMKFIPTSKIPTCKEALMN